MTSVYAVAPTAAAQEIPPEPQSHPCLGIYTEPPWAVCPIQWGEKAYFVPSTDAEADLTLGTVELVTSSGTRIPVLTAWTDAKNACDPWAALDRFATCEDPEEIIPVSATSGETGVFCLQEARFIMDTDGDGDADIDTGTLSACPGITT